MENEERHEINCLKSSNFPDIVSVSREIPVEVDAEQQLGQV